MGSTVLFGPAALDMMISYTFPEATFAAIVYLNLIPPRLFSTKELILTLH